MRQREMVSRRRAQPTVDSSTFQRKLSDVWDGIESDWVSIVLYDMKSMQIKKKTANLWKYNVGNNVNIVNFDHTWRAQNRGIYCSVSA